MGDEDGAEFELDADLTGRAPDGYEAEYMAGAGRVLFRDKTMAPKLLHAMFGVPALVAAVTGVMSLGEVGLAGALPLFAATGALAMTWTLFSVLRVTVSGRQLQVQYGLFGPTVPIEDILEVSVGDYDWKKFGGWGIRRAFDGTWAYNMIGDGGRAVTIHYRDGDRVKKVLIASRQAELLYDALRRARRALGQAGADEREMLHEEESRRGDAAPEVEHEVEVELDGREGRR